VSNQKISLGQLKFINSMPVNYPFERWRHSKIIVNSGYPTLINQLFKDELLHVAPVSSIEYLKNKDKYSLIDTICISSGGEVDSVILFSNYEIENLKNKIIGVPYTSATSIALLKILLKEYGIPLDSCKFVTHKYQQSLENALLSQFDAILYIGDPALVANIHNKSKFKYDLGLEWKKISGLPMVFANWVVWSDWKSAYPDDWEWISIILDKAVEAGLNMYLNDVVEKSSRLLNLDKKVIQDYLTCKIQYKFTDKHRESLQLFNSKYQMISEYCND